jgi:hypothetical protein
MRRETQQKPARKGMINMKDIVNIAGKMEKMIMIFSVATLIVCFCTAASFASFSMQVSESGIYGGTTYDIKKIEVFDLGSKREFENPYAGNFSAGSWTAQMPNTNYVLATNASADTSNFNWTLYFTGNKSGAKLDLAYLVWTSTGEVYGTYLTKKGNATALTYTTIAGLNINDPRFDRTGATVPIPPAVFLFGGGLLGLAVLRKKIRA